MEPSANTSTASAEVISALQSFVSQQQSQQTPIWNTLSLQMAQNRQMTDSILALHKMQQQSQGLNQLPDTKRKPSSTATSTAAISHPPLESISDEEDDSHYPDNDLESNSNLGSEVDFEDFSNYSELDQPLTLVEKIEKLYDRLPRLLRPPPQAAQAASSVRDIPEISGRVRSLPSPPVILDSFQKFRASYRKTEGTSLVVDDNTGEKVGMVDESEYSKKK